MLMIRLSRVGKTKEPSYRLVISEKTKDPWGDSLEILGFFNPRSNPVTAHFKGERINYWISKGAQMSDTVHNLLVDQGLLSNPKRKVAHKGKTETPAATPPAEKTTEEKK